MAQSPELLTELQSRDVDFALGANSFTDPSQIPERQYLWGENIINRGGDIGTRFGFFNRLKFNCGRAQGMALFRPSSAVLPSLYIAISGEIWRSDYPFDSAFQLPNIQFRPDLDFIVFKEALVANSPSAAVQPYLVLIMQDGISQAAYTDGNISRHLDPTPNGFYSPFSIGPSETRIGLAMEYVGGRLWVANGKELFASDIFDPLHFTETTYLAGGGSFQAFDGDTITALKRTLDNKQLLIGTIGNTTALDAGNTTRSTWASNIDFERLLFAGVGWVGPKCCGELNSELFWMSPEGVRFYNSVGNSSFSARRSITSHEMERSWKNRGPVLSRVCAGSHDSYGLLGVPSGDQYNRHIWAIDTSSSDLLTSQNPYAWQPIWKGIRPVEIVNGVVNGENRCFALEQGRDIPRVWELFYKRKRDYYMLNGIPNEQPIQCRAETRGHSFGEMLSFKKFHYIDAHIKEVFGNVSLTAQYKNEYGCYRDIGTWNFCTTECMQFVNCALTPTPDKQSRYAKSQKPTGQCNEGGSPFVSDIGTYFTFRYDWTGELSFRALNAFAIQHPEKTKGAPSCPGGEADPNCIALNCCDAELDYWSSPEELLPIYYYNTSTTCDVTEVTNE